MDDNHELFAPAAAEEVGGDAPAPAPARRAGVIDQKRGAANFLLVKQHGWPSGPLVMKLLKMEMPTQSMMLTSHMPLICQAHRCLPI